MADKTIGELADGTAPQDSDEFVVERGSGNNKLSWAELVSALDGLFDASGAAAAAQAASQPLDSDLTSIAALSTTTYGRALLTLASAGAADWITKALLTT